MRFGAKLGFGVGIAFLAHIVGCSTQETTKKEYTSRERAQLIVGIANGALVEGDPTGALQNLVRAEKEDPTLPELFHSKALAYFAKHDLENAIVASRRALQLQPDFSAANNTLGKLLIDAGRFEEAETVLMKAAKDSLFRDAYKAWTSLGVLKYRQNEFSAAEVFLGRAIQESPTQACIAFYYRGHIQLRRKKFGDAVSDYSNATKKRCAMFGEADLALGMAYQHNRQYESARKTFLEVQKRYPNTKLAEQAIDHLRYLP